MSSPDSLRETISSNVGVVIVAAGGSTRMKGVNKIFLPLQGEPLVSYSLDVFNSLPYVKEIALVLSQDFLDEGSALVKSRGWENVRHVCAGGARRQDSVYSGLRMMPDVDWVIVHDGARPFVHADMINAGMAEAQPTGAAVAAVPVKDTIKLADGNQRVTQTLRRENLWAIQTPQIFRRDLLVNAHEKVKEDVTDDASMVELAGGEVRVFMGSYANIKVTTPEDIIYAEAILASRVSSIARGSI